jgi:hypothetical protein
MSDPMRVRVTQGRQQNSVGLLKHLLRKQQKCPFCLNSINTTIQRKEDVTDQLRRRFPNAVAASFTAQQPPPPRRARQTQQNIRRMTDDQLIQYYNQTGDALIQQFASRLRRIERLQQRVQLINKIQQKHSTQLWNSMKEDLLARFGPKPIRQSMQSQEEEEDLYS